MSDSDDLQQALHSITRLLEAREADFDSLRQMQLEWLQFQTTLNRLVHLMDGNGRPPVADRILLVEESVRRLELLAQQFDALKARLIALLLGVTLSLIAAIYSALR